MSSLFNSRNPAGVAVGQLGLLTTVLASGVADCHTRGLAAMQAAREARAQDDIHGALHQLQRANEELGILAQRALEEVARQTRANADLQTEVRVRQEHINTLRVQRTAANGA
jgi:type IV secretory pathway VirJ component